MDLSIFYDILSAMGSYSKAISLWKLLSFAVTHHFVATHHPYTSACGVDKNYQKWQEIQLAVHYGDGSLIAIKQV